MIFVSLIIASALNKLLKLVKKYKSTWAHNGILYECTFW